MCIVSEYTTGDEDIRLAQVRILFVPSSSTDAGKEAAGTGAVRAAGIGVAGKEAAGTGAVRAAGIGVEGKEASAASASFRGFKC